MIYIYSPINIFPLSHYISTIFHMIFPTIFPFDSHYILIIFPLYIYIHTAPEHIPIICSITFLLYSHYIPYCIPMIFPLYSHPIIFPSNYIPMVSCPVIPMYCSWTLLTLSRSLPSGPRWVLPRGPQDLPVALRCQCIREPGSFGGAVTRCFDQCGKPNEIITNYCCGQLDNTSYIWVNYNDLTATSLEIMVNKGNHPQMALIQVSEIL